MKDLNAASDSTDLPDVATLFEILPGLAYRCCWDDWPAMAFVSTGATALTGFTREEFLGAASAQLGNLIHADDVARVRRELAQAVASDRPWRIGYRLRHRLGHYIDVLDRGRAEPRREGGRVHLAGFIEDVSEQESDRRDLEQARFLMASIIDNVPALVFLKDAAELRFEMGNRALEDLLGRPFAQLEGVTDYDLFPEEQAAAFQADDRRALASPVPVVIEEEPITSVTGELRYLRTAKTALRNAQGEIAHLLGIALDITEQRNAQVAVKEAEAHMRAVLDGLFSFVAVVSAKGVLTTANRAPLEAAGLKSKDVVGRMIWDTPWFAHSRQVRTQLRDACERAIEGNPLRFDTVVRLGVRNTPIDMMLSPLKDAAGEVTQIVLSAVDISERRAAEEELRKLNLELERRVALRTASLRESEARFQSAMQHSAIGMALVSPEGRWLDANHATCRITGYTRDELLSMDFQSITHPDDIGPDLENLQRLLAGEIESFEMEKRYIHKAGHLVWALLSVSLVRTSDGSPHYLIAQIQDITARRQVEAAMQAVSTDLIALDGQDFYDTAALRLAEVLEADVAFIARPDPAAPGTAQTIAFAVNGEILPNTVIPLADTPCMKVLQGETCIVRSGLLNDYPEGAMVRRFGADAYAAEPIWDRSGRVVGHLGVFRRVPFAGTIGIEETLKVFSLAVAAATIRDRDRQQYEALFEFAPDALVMIDSEGSIRLVNQQAEQMFGWSRSELCGRSVEVLMPPEMHVGHVSLRRKFLTSAMPRAMGGGRSDLHGMRKDGTVFPVDISLSPMETEDGQLIAAAVRDVSHRVKAEQAMQQALATLDATDDAAFMFDPDTLRFIYVNEGAMHQLGYSREELLTMTPVEIKPLYEEAGFRAMLAPLVAGEQSVARFTTLHRHKNGKDIAVEVNLQYVESAGAKGRFIAIVRDITERLEQEADRAARDAAEQANAAKSTFLATMSHEIRTPMNGVIGSIDLLARSSLKPHQAELAETIRESSFSLLAVIDDVLDFSKIEAGRLELEHEPVSIERVVEAVTSALRPLALRKDVYLDIFTDPRLPDRIVSDGVRLRQILANLVTNAIKFSSGPDQWGRVSVRAEPAEPGMLRLVVQDNGIGMSPQAQAKLFQPFVQAEASTTRRYGGTGLGLTICQRLVELFAGRIGVESREGEGARFEVVIPYAADNRAQPPQLLPNVAGLRCLVVADSPQCSADWCAYLNAAGAHAEPAESFEAAAGQLTQESASDAVAILAGDIAAARIWRSNLSNQGGQAPGMVLLGRGQRRSPRLVEDGIAALDSDAMPRRLLLKAVAIAAGREKPENEESLIGLGGDRYAPPTREVALAEGRLVLVAEDNDVNQKVIRRQLALLGLAADIVENGRDALMAWRSGSYPLVLTDLHMPDMDGYELATTIRAEEGEGAHIPIVALTANAIRGEDERCRLAGMDAFIIKPVELETLRAALKPWLPAVARPDHEPDREALIETRGEAAAEGAVETPPEAADSLVFDRQALVRLVGDNRETIVHLLSNFRGSAAGTVNEMVAAADAGNLPVVGALAHRLKSSARAVGATALASTCADLEQAARFDDGAAVSDLFAGFEATFAQALAAIEGYEDEIA